MEQNVNSNVPNTIKFYFSVCVLPIGILLNALSIQLFLKNSLNKSTNMGMLYGCLSCLNVIALVNVLIFNILEFYEYDYESTEFTCRFMNVWTKMVLQLPSFQQVIIAFYLWLSICYPNKFKDAIKKTLYCEIGIFVYIMCMNMLNLGYYIGEENFTSNSSNATLFCTILNELDFTNDFISVLNRAVLPCILIFWLNTLSLNKIVHMDKKFNKEKKSSNFINSALGMNFTFLLVYLPWGIVFLVYHIKTYLDDNPGNLQISSFVQYFYFQMIFSLCDCISYLNNIAPFFLNLAFNTIFRKEIFSLLNIKMNENKISMQSDVNKSNIPKTVSSIAVTSVIK
jgi:hypothetical protein